MIPISKKILFLVTAVITIFVIQFCSINNANGLSVSASNSTNNINNSNGNNGNRNGIITSGIQVDSYPVGIAVNPNTDKIYVANEFSNTVSIIDESTDKVQATIKVGSFPYGIDVNPLNNRVYVANRGSNTVSVIDGSTNLKMADVHVGKSPIDVAVNPSSNLVYVTNIESGTVSVLDGITNTVSSTIKVGDIPYAIAVNPVTNITYVTDIGDGSISILQNSKKDSGNSSSNNGAASTLEKIDGIIIAPAGIAINTSTNKAYVTDYASNTVFVIDLKTGSIIHRIKVGTNPVGISVNPISNRIYVTNVGDNTVSVIDGSKDQMLGNTSNSRAIISVNPFLKPPFSDYDPSAKIPINVKFPLIASFAAVNTASNKAYVTNTASNAISVIDGNKDTVLVKLNFNINPPNAGEIVCNGIRSLGTNSTLFSKGETLQCVANPHHGYSFDSWSGLTNSLSNPLTVQISQFGTTLSANFEQTLPPETYLFIGLAIVGSIPVFIGWYNKNRQKHYLNLYLSKIESIYSAFFQNDSYSKEEYVMHLEQIRKEILRLFRKGKISDTYYTILDKKTTDYISLGMIDSDHQKKSNS
ncbi:MAG TPA: beta-propeller fold lactonase family protein [Nitrososphaeraceae archaeon]|jgi:YVTN family beta-propeller protein